MLPVELQNKDPLGYPFFRMVITRSQFYINSLKRNGTKWLGLTFHYLLIWCGGKIYKIDALWNEHEETVVWMEVDNNFDLHANILDGHPPYS